VLVNPAMKALAALSASGRVGWAKTATVRCDAVTPTAYRSTSTTPRAERWVWMIRRALVACGRAARGLRGRPAIVAVPLPEGDEELDVPVGAG